MRSRIAAALLLTSVAQAGCYTARPGPTGPISPGDSTAVQALSQTWRVRVSTLAGSEFTLNDPVVADGHLFGTRGYHPPQERSLPLDSIARTEIPRFSYIRTGLLVTAIGGAVSALVIGSMVASSDEWDFDLQW